MSGSNDLNSSHESIVKQLREHQRRQLSLGTPLSFDELLALAPPGSLDDDARLELILVDIAQRHAFGQSTDPHAYAASFPHLAERLARLLALQSALFGGESAGIEHSDKFPVSEDLDLALEELGKANGPNPETPRAAAAVSIERNLLFALLGLQNGFLDRDQLVAAFSLWTIDKSRSIESILAAQGVLRPDQVQLLTALAAHHLGQHDDDPGKSLAAMSSLGSAPDDLALLDDADIQRSLAHVRRPLGPGRVPSAPVIGQASVPGSRFRLLRPHAEGGLGQVSVALDTELNREVAFKEIRP